MTGMTEVVKVVTRLMAGLMFVFGAYIILHGHLTPGGGFAGGVVIAGAFVLGVLAFGAGRTATPEGKARASHVEAGAILAFWGIALAGLVIGGVWFSNFLPEGDAFTLPSGGTIPLSNLAIGIEVAAALVCIYLALLVYRRGDGA